MEISFYLAVIALTCAAGYYVKSLSVSGAIAAFVTGSVIALGFQWKGLLLLGVFFASSSLWSKYKKQQKGKLDEVLEKGERRDWVQVAANSSVASFTSLMYYFTELDMWMLGFIVAIAAANADTWGSEIGVLSKSNPYYILSLRQVEKGTSGAVSILGTVASLLGSLCIALFAFFLFSFQSFALLVMIVFLGFSGSLLDTVLGATCQARYTCTACGLITEKREHCASQTRLTKGIRWYNNDFVNWTSITLVTCVSLFLT
ncbi:MAG: DUF92 domain-containing protein [Bacillus sp. (in: firmicutes)]